MPRQNSIIASWTKGEVSPLAHGRIDVNLYAMGAGTIENLIVRPQGPVFRRSGTKFVKKAHLNDATISALTNSGGFYRLDLATSTDYQVGDYVTVTGTNTAVDGVVRITGVQNTTTGFLTTDKVYVSGAGAVSGRVVRTIRCIPFIVSDETAYVLEFGDRYIHIYKNKEPLFETTTTEVEKYTISTAATNPQIDTSVDDDGDLPGWGDLSAFFIGPPADNGTLVTSNNGSGLVRVTTSVPHTLRTGVTVKMYQTANPSSLNGNTYVVDRITPYVVDLRSSAFVSNAGVTDTAMVSLGLMAGDRVFFSGGEENTLGESFRDVKSVDTYDKFTVANYLSSAIVDTTPSNEEVHVIPVEIVTTYKENELNDLHYVQSADVMYLFHPDHKPQKLVRLDTDGDRNDWLLADANFQDGPYLPLNDLSPNVDTTTPANGAKYTDVYFQLSSYAHTATVTSATDFTDATDDDGNHYIEYRNGDQWRLAKIQSGSISGAALRTATVDIIDNVLLAVDAATRLSFKSSKPVQVPGSGNNSLALYTKTSSISPRSRTNNNTNIVDPRNSLQGIIAGGNLTGQFANTFSSNDFGKFVRFNTSATPPLGAWAQINGNINTTGTTVTTAAAVTMATNNHTGLYILSNESRTATLNAFRAGSAFSAFASTDVGRHVRLGFSGRWTWGIITTYTSASQVTVTLYEDVPRDLQDARNIAGHNYGFNPGTNALTTTNATTGITYDWRMGAWSDTTGWPQVGTFHEERLWLAATTVQPQTIWGSVSGDFENMMPTELDSAVLDDDAITVTLGSTKVNAIKWMLSGPAMNIGTNGGEWQMRANSSINEAITPSNVKVVEYTGHGSMSRPIPARVGSSVLFVDRSGEKVHELFYDYTNDSLNSDDLTVISEHILRDHGGAITSAFQQKPHSIYWVACADGTLSAMTFNKKQEVVAWHHHTLAGGGLVKDICVIPSEDDSQDELWMVVERTINSMVVRYLEVLEEDFYPSSSSSRLGMRFLDGFKLIENFTGTGISGLDYLEGQSVVVVKDGTRVSGTFTVTSGAITITAATSEILIGLNGNADLVSLPPEGGSQFGTSQGQMKRLVYMDTRFYNSNQLKFGPSFSSLISKTLPVTSPTVWFTGTDRIVPAHGYSVESSWYIRQDEPYPLNILFVVAKLETNE